MLYLEGLTCRVCLSISSDTISMFEGAHAAALREKLEFVVRTELSRHEALPSGLCGPCRIALDAAHAFVVRCIAAESVHVRTIKTECTSLPRDLAPSSRTGNEPESPPCAEQQFFYEEYNTISGPRARVKVKVRKRGAAQATRCEVCGLETRAPSALVVHMRRHTGERPYRCAHCGRTFAQKGTLAKHAASRHCDGERSPPPRLFTCDACGKQFVRKRDVAVHMRIHTGETPYACTVCHRRFKQLGPLIRHRRIHTGERPFLCSECPKRFADRTSLSAHATAHSDERRYACATCGKLLKTANSLRKHADRHAFGRRHVCDVCGHAFALKGNLKMHLQRMHSERSGVCLTCGASTPDLEEHARRHTGCLLPCTLCRRKFLRAAGLRTHLRRHAHTSRHACAQRDCGAAFPTPGALQRHAVEAHAHSMPHACAHCSRSFLRLCDLTKHSKMAHKMLKIEYS